MSGRYYVYILASGRNGVLYTGVTNALAQRVQQHRDGDGSAFTRRYNITRLVYAAPFDDIEAAIAHEKRLKRWRRAWKVQLIEAENPYWADLAEHI
jgi:putative endonuclease